MCLTGAQRLSSALGSASPTARVVSAATWLNHLAESKGLEASSPTQHSNLDELPSELDEIMLPVHIKEIKKQSIFDTTTTRSLTPVLESNSTQSKEPRTRFPFELRNTASIYQNAIQFNTPSWQEEGLEYFILL